VVLGTALVPKSKLPGTLRKLLNATAPNRLDTPPLSLLDLKQRVGRLDQVAVRIKRDLPVTPVTVTFERLSTIFPRSSESAL
jgi:hypothetical protein